MNKGSILDEPNVKYNTTVDMTPEDQEKGVKILCKEPYAQEVYNKLVAQSPINGIWAPCKDLIVGRVYRVQAKTVDYQNKIIIADEIESNTPVFIPIRDFSRDPQELIDGIESEFYVLITRDRKGEYMASEKKAIAITHKQDLINAGKTNQPFDVKVERLIKGGFVASYQDTVKCFIPGSHAAANVIRDFDSYIGKVIPVIIDNYDSANDLFIVSYKKYIKSTMAQKITELSFGKEYTGVLTDRPKSFGVFVEIDGYFTGLIHSSEFDDYESIKREWQAGKEITCFIKDVNLKKGQYRIFLTLDEEDVNKEKKRWSTIREHAQGKTFAYDADLDSGMIYININGEQIGIGVKPKKLRDNYEDYPYVRVYSVDPIKREIKLDFAEDDL